MLALEVCLRSVVLLLNHLTTIKDRRYQVICMWEHVSMLGVDTVKSLRKFLR